MLQRENLVFRMQMLSRDHVFITSYMKNSLLKSGTSHLCKKETVLKLMSRVCSYNYTLYIKTFDAAYSLRMRPKFNTTHRKL